MEDITRKKSVALRFISYDGDVAIGGMETCRDCLIKVGNSAEGFDYNFDPETHPPRDGDENRNVSIMSLGRYEQTSDNFRWG